MKHRVFPSWLGCALLCGAATAFAAKPPAPPPGHPASLEQAVKQVQHETRGHILAADTVSRGNAKVYRIKVLTPQGQVRVVQMHSTARPKPGKSDTDKGGH
jgi:hypothetical protein